MPANTLRGCSKHEYNESKIAVGRHFEKIAKSPYLSNDLTDQHEIWHGDASWLTEQCAQSKFRIFRNSRWQTAAVLKNRKIVISRQLFDTVTYNHPKNRITVSAVKHYIAAVKKICLYAMPFDAMRPFVKIFWPLVVFMSTLPSSVRALSLLSTGRTSTSVQDVRMDYGGKYRSL